MKKYGFVASGGGYRSFYTAGVLVWLQNNSVPITHITSTSSGNNIVLDYFIWDWESEDLPPVLTKTMRLNIADVYDVFKNFLGLSPPIIPNGTYLFSVNKNITRKSLLLDDTQRRTLFSQHLETIQWDILTTNLSQRSSEGFRINDILAEFNDDNLNEFIDVFVAGITTIPYFEAAKINGQYYLEGGYTDNTPLRPLFEDPQVEEIIVIDFTDYDYHKALENIYKSSMFTLPKNSIDLNLLVNDIQWCLPNISVLSQAKFINQLLQTLEQDTLIISGKTYFYKPLHILTPSNLESMTISLKDMRAQKNYFKIGQDQIQILFETF